MNKRKFLVQLFSVTAALAAIIYTLQIFRPFQSSIWFSATSLAFFFFLSVGMFFLAAKSAMNKDKNAFTRLIMVFTLAKMLLTVVLVITYQMVVKPEELYYVIPFFLIYITFTVFETIFLTKLGKIKAR